MNIVRRLTMRHLKENKKRSMTTIFGIIVSVAMITAVSTSVTSLLGLMSGTKEQIDGDWVGYYSNIEEKKIQTVKDYKNIKDVILCQDEGNWIVGNELSPDGKEMLSVRAQQTDSFSHVPINFLEGTNPTAPNEIAISRKFLLQNGLQWKVGDTVTLTGLKREWTKEREKGSVVRQFDGYEMEKQQVTIEQPQQYKLVGLMENYSGASGYTAIVGLEKNAIAAGSLVDIYTTQTKLSFSSDEQVEKLGKVLGHGYGDLHSDYLRYQGYFIGPEATMVYGICSIIMAIIVIASFTLIYNAFSISVSERSRYLGMLSSVGATKKQKRMSVYFEGAILGAIGIPLGIIAGLGGIGITFRIVSPMMKDVFMGDVNELKMIVSGAGLAMSILLSIFTIFISSYIPGRRASNTTAIDAIRGTKEITAKAKQLKTSKLTRKIFGYEGELALKNMKRNKRKYRIIVASLAVSMVLFLAVNSFSALTNKSLEIAIQSEPYDIQIYSRDAQQMKKTSEFVAGLKGIDKSVNEVNWNIAMIGKNKVFDARLSAQQITKEEQILPIHILGIADDEFRTYCKKEGIDAEPYFNSAELKVIVRNNVTLMNKSEAGDVIFQEVNPFHIAAGDKQQGLGGYSRDDTGNIQVREEEKFVIEVGAVVKDKTFGNASAVTAFLPLSTLQGFCNAHQNLGNPDQYTNLFTTQYKEVGAKIDQFVTDTFGEETEVYVNNVSMQKDGIRQIVVIMEIFTYGFIALIGLICVTNIFNTIATGIQLRRREFAMIKSVGMSPKGFYKMISCESLFYGIKALLIGLPLGVVAHFAIFRLLMGRVSLSLWDSFDFSVYGATIGVVFLIVGMALVYSMGKVKKDNIIDTLKSEDN